MTVSNNAEAEGPGPLTWAFASVGINSSSDRANVAKRGVAKRNKIQFIRTGLPVVNS